MNQNKKYVLLFIEPTIWKKKKKSQDMFWYKSGTTNDMEKMGR